MDASEWIRMQEQIMMSLRTANTLMVPSVLTEMARIQDQVAASVRATAMPDVAAEIARVREQLAASVRAPAFPDIATEMARVREQLAASVHAAVIPDVATEMARIREQLAASLHASAFPNIVTEIARIREQFTASVSLPIRADILSDVARLQIEIAGALRPSATESPLASPAARPEGANEGDEELASLRQVGPSRTVFWFECMLRWFVATDVAEALVGDFHERRGSDGDDDRPLFVEVAILLWLMLVSTFRDSCSSPDSENN